MSFEIYNNIFNQLNHAVLVTNKELNIISVNNSLLSLFGYLSCDELIGKKITMLVPDNHAKKHNKYVENYHKTGKSQIIGKGRKIYGKHKTGKKIPIFIVVSVDSINGTYIVIMNDITREVQRDEFLSFICHELRNPLQGIMGFSELLLYDRNKNDKDYKFIKGINTSANVMKQITNDVLDLSKIYAGKLTIEQIPIDFDELLYNVLQQSSKPKENVTITTSLSKDILLGKILGDPTRLNQILNNLVGNAIKFTEYGMINISISIENKTDKHYFVKFKVQDTGIGIDQKNIACLFDAFTQEKVSITRHYGGTGLGLPICHQLVKIMGGNEINVNSKLGFGTSFSFIIPMSYIQEEIQDNDNNVLMINYIQEKCSVLIVEDNEINQDILGTILNRVCTKVDIADNGLIGFNKWKNGKYKCVFMDIQMPVLDGISTTLRIREFEKDNNLEEVPIIATTGSVLQSEKESYINAGINHIIEKPYSEKEIMDIIDKLLK